MTTKVLKDIDDTPSKAFAAWCVMDEKQRSDKYINNYTPTQVEAGKKLYNMAVNAWFRSKVYINYRDNFIAVKVDHPTSADRLSDAVTELEDFVKHHNIERAIRRSSLIYRIKVK